MRRASLLLLRPTLAGHLYASPSSSVPPTAKKRLFTSLYNIAQRSMVGLGLPSVTTEGVMRLRKPKSIHTLAWHEPFLKHSSSSFLFGTQSEAGSAGRTAGQRDSFC